MMDLVGRVGPFERGIEVNFDGETDGDTAIIDFIALAKTTSNYKFRPTAVLINGSAAAVATIRGILWGNSGSPRSYTLECNRPHYLSFSKIYNEGTTRNTFQVLGV